MTTQETATNGNNVDVCAARIEAAQARVKAAEDRRKKRAQMDAMVAAEADADASEMVADLEDEHGTHAVMRFESIVGPIVLLRGPEASFKRYKTHLEKTINKPTDEQESMRFIQPSLKYPKSLNELLDKAPGLLDTIAIKLMALYGNKHAEDLGK